MLSMNAGSSALIAISDSSWKKEFSLFDGAAS
jgi:hypothetical protein